MIETTKVSLTKENLQPKAEKNNIKAGHRFQEAMQRYQQTKSNHTADKQSTNQEDSVAQTKALTDENKPEQLQENPEMVHASDSDDKLQESIGEKEQIDATNLNDALFAQLANPLMVQEPSPEQSPLQEIEADHLVPIENVQIEDAIPTPYTVVAKQLDASTMELTIKSATENINTIDRGNQLFQPSNFNAEQMDLVQAKPTINASLTEQIPVNLQDTLASPKLKKVELAPTLVANDATAMMQVTSLQNNLQMLNEPQAMIEPATLNVTVEKTSASVAEVLTNQVAQKIVEQTQTLNAPGMQKVTIQLQPDQLGKLEISLQLNQHQVQLEVKAENSHTMKLLENLSAKFEQILNKQQFLQQPASTRLEIPTHNEGLGSALQQNFQQSFQQSNFYQSKPVNRYAKSTEKMVVEEKATDDKEVLDSTISILA